MPRSLSSAPRDRLALIDSARRCRAGRRTGGQPPAIEPWLERSWRRCIARGQRPEHAAGFRPDSGPGPAAGGRGQPAPGPGCAAGARALVAGPGQHPLFRRADQPGRHRHRCPWADRPRRRAGRPDHPHRRGPVRGRSVGTTAIGAALSELQPVWLHRGEHFFADTSVYSCAGAPLFGPDGRCVGMLDLTGIDAAERPELKHLAAQSARSIENALTLTLPAQPPAAPELAGPHARGRGRRAGLPGRRRLDPGQQRRRASDAAGTRPGRRPGPLQRAVRAALGIVVRRGAPQRAAAARSKCRCGRACGCRRCRSCRARARLRRPRGCRCAKWRSH